MKFYEFLIILFALLIVFSCGQTKRDKQQEAKDTTASITKSNAERVTRDQYRIAVNLEGSRDQIVDLIQGSSVFEIVYEGQGHFLAVLKHVDGNHLAVLADKEGSFREKVRVEIPVTTAYIIEVKCDGVWSLYRE